MPTRPVEKLLDRDLSAAAARELIDIACPLLEELVNYGTQAWARCAASASGQPNEDVAPLMLYLHITEFTDAIEVLLRRSCAAPAVPLLRSSFEALLYLEYILESDAECVRRSLCWLAGDAHDRIDHFSAFDPSTPQGKEAAKHLSLDIIAPHMGTWPPDSAVKEASDNLRSLLSRPEFKEIEREYTRHKKRPVWHKLFGGPSNLAELAKHRRRYAQYQLLYRSWSSVTHATSPQRFITRTASGSPGVWSLRNAGQFHDSAMYAANFMLSATSLVLNKHRKTEGHKEWYMREVREPYLMLSRLSVNVTEAP